MTFGRLIDEDKKGAHGTLRRERKEILSIYLLLYSPLPDVRGRRKREKGGKKKGKKKNDVVF